MKTGLIKTAYGPVFWLLFSFPSPFNGTMTTYEVVVNPTDDEHLAPFRALADQAYWHVVIADTDGSIVNLFEFPNSYGLGQALDDVSELCEAMNGTNFWAAKAEYQARYSVDDLLKACESNS